jgi:hypothetical protein
MATGRHKLIFHSSSTANQLPGGCPDDFLIHGVGEADAYE